MQGSSIVKRDYDDLFKLVLIGDSCVGKSCLLIRFADDCFTENYITTIGVDFRFRTLNLNKKIYKLQIWDTAGQERYRTITSAYYRGADGIIIVFDLSDKESFNHVHDWIMEVEKFTPKEEVIKLVLANKADLEEEQAVTDEDIERFTKETGIKVLKTSAKTGENVDEGFSHLTKKLVSMNLHATQDLGQTLGKPTERKSTSTCCS